MKKYNKITVIVSSRKKMEENQEFLKNLQETVDFNMHVMYCINQNGAPLTQVYQEHLQKSDTDIVVFLHDDIEILKKGWGLELVKLFQENEDYGIIGVAGSSTFNLDGAWWNNEPKYGQVIHRNNGNMWLTKYSDLFDGLKETCCVDGVFFAIEKTRATIGFDTNLEGFHFYDIDFCLNNFVNNTCKIGVTTNVRLAHNSIGAINETWVKNKDIIIEKYKDYLPIERIDEDRRINNK